MWFRNRTTDLFIYVRKRVLNWEVKDMIIDKKKSGKTKVVKGWGGFVGGSGSSPCGQEFTYQKV